MGFIVSQSVNHPLYGQIQSFYSRIERYLLFKHGGQLNLTVSSYYNKDSAEILNTTDLNADVIEGYPVVGEIEYNGSLFDMNELNFHRIFLTSSYLEVTDIYEEMPVSESVDYFIYDDDGNMIPTSSFEVVYRFVKTGETFEEKTRVDFSLVTQSLYDFSYNIVKQKFGEVFGHENIIDS